MFDRKKNWKYLQSRQLGVWTITTTEKQKAQHYTILTHAGLPLQSNKDLAPCMLVYEPLKIPRQKWGDKEYSRSSTPKTGGPKLGQY